MANRIDTATKVCGLIGYPIGHSVSPLIHNTLAQRYGQNLVYIPLQTEPGTLQEAVRGAAAFGFQGMNVTIPYKQEVIGCLDEIDPLAKQIGAVNTLVRTEHGYKGYNTDMPGLYRAMCADGVPVEQEEVILLGAGGVARAVSFLLLQKGAAHLYLLNRSLEKAQELAQELNSAAGRDFVTPLTLQQYPEIPDGKYLTIQATNVGMYPKTEQAVIEEPAFYAKVKTAYDIIFNPMKTRFMSLAQEAGADAYNGLKMLLYQGVIAFEYWTGVSVSEKDALRIYGMMQEALRPKGKENVILIGFMGSGKTTVGRLLGRHTGMRFCDTDQMIEQRAGKTITEIFAQEGEESFRQKETETLQALVADPDFTHRVIAVGGGTPLREENRKLLAQLGRVVYLKVTPETVYHRLRRDRRRPLLQGENPQQKIHDLLSQREKNYAEAAGMTLPCDRIRPEKVAELLMHRLKLKAKKTDKNR